MLREFAQKNWASSRFHSRLYADAHKSATIDVDEGMPRGVPCPLYLFFV